MNKTQVMALLKASSLDVISSGSGRQYLSIDHQLAPPALGVALRLNQADNISRRISKLGKGHHSWYFRYVLDQFGASGNHSLQILSGIIDLIKTIDGYAAAAAPN